MIPLGLLLVFEQIVIWTCVALKISQLQKYSSYK